ncbi:MAG: hypothetical protein QOJ07_2517 [Thermoleophilaceae bacterium]|nr:hypothetical protein [Thermoleophilaceae bacterium]
MTQDKGGEAQPVRRFAVADDLRETGYSGLVLERLARHVCRVADVDRACVFVIDRGDPRALIAAAAHGAPDDLVGSRVGTDEGVLGRVFASGEAQVVTDSLALGAPLGGDFGHGVVRAAFVPILHGQSVGGVLAVATLEHARRFDAARVDLLRELADMAAAALDHSGPRYDTPGSVAAHVDALAAAVDVRDRTTAAHSEDVVALARLVGGLLELDGPALLELEFAARLHDVGKIRVPDAILNKPGPLDDAERVVMRCHAAWGAETLAGVPGLEVVATIVRFHHERWDGGGYPDRLAGGRIPLASRIIAVCDAFGAMTCDRPYRDGMPDDWAIAELRSGAGSQFDPAVVEAFCEAVVSHPRATP